MALSQSCVDKLCTVIGGVIFAGGAAAAAANVSPGLLEAFIGAGTLATFWRQDRAQDCTNILRRVSVETHKAYEAFIRAEFRDIEFARMQLEEVERAFEAIVDHIKPTQTEIVACNLDRSCIVEILRQKAARKDSLFAGNASDFAQQFFIAVVGQTYDRLRQTESFAQLTRSYVDEALLKGQGEIQRIQFEMKQTMAGLPEQLLAILEQQGYVKQVHAAGGSSQLVLSLACRYVAAKGDSEEPIDIERAEIELRAAVELAIGFLRKGSHKGNYSSIVDVAFDRASELIRKNDLEGASHAIDNGLSDLDSQEKENAEAVKRSRIALLKRGVEHDRLRFDAAGVAARMAKIVEVEYPSDDEDRFRAMELCLRALYVEGRDRGTNFVLEVGIAIAKKLIDNTVDGERRARAYIFFGTISDELGLREKGTVRLKAAIAAYRATLKEWPRKRAPLNWAMVQNNLGCTLLALGEREGGAVWLEEAVVAHRAALKERKKKLVPSDWAATQTNLGTALKALAVHRGDIALLKKAVLAYRSALRQLVSERNEFKAIQTNLGSALLELARHEDDTARIKEAVAIFEAVLEKEIREQAPFGWAAAQNNLGNALSMLGLREGDPVVLERALVAFRAAVEEWTRDKIPLNWAMVQNNLGATLLELSELTHDMALMEDAVVAFEAALEERTREGVPLEWAATQSSLGNVLARMYQHKGDAVLERAVEAYRAALQEWTRERVPLDWAETQNRLGTTLALLGLRRVDMVRLEEAIVAYLAAQSEKTRDRTPLQWAKLQSDIARILAILGSRERGTQRLEEAEAAYKAALEELSPENASESYDSASSGLARCLELLAIRKQ